MKFSSEFSKKQIPECLSAPYISNETDLGQVLVAIKKRCIDKLKLHELFLCDVPTVLKKDFVPAI